MPSQALVALRRDRIPEARVLMSLDPSRTKGAHGDAARANALNRGAAVLLAAHLQGFLEELVVEVIDHLNSADLDKWDVPARLLAAHVEQHLNALSTPTEILDRLDRVVGLFREHALYWTDCTVGPNKLSANAVTRHIGNPWPGVIKRSMALIGADNPFEHATLNDARQTERQIKELVGKRNEIAHGTGAPSLTAAQLDSYLQAVEDIAVALDDTAAEFVQAICNARERPWP